MGIEYFLFSLWNMVMHCLSISIYIIYQHNKVWAIFNYTCSTTIVTPFLVCSSNGALYLVLFLKYFQILNQIWDCISLSFRGIDSNQIILESIWLDTATYRNINNKFSVKYYLNLVLVDEEDRRYFKQQEIKMYRLLESWTRKQGIL